MTTAAVFGTAFERIVPITANLTITDGATNLVVAQAGGLSGAVTLTLPTVQQMIAAQNRELFVANNATSGGTVNVVAPSGNTLVGRAQVVVAAGAVFRHDGISTWYGF